MGTEESASFMRKGLNSYASMPPNEKAAFSTNIICMFDYADVLRRLHEKGLVTEDVLNPVMLNMLGLIHTPGGAQWWEKIGPILTIYPYLTALEVNPEDVPDLLDSMDYFDPRYLANEPGRH